MRRRQGESTIREPNVKKHPTELFGFPYVIQNSEAKNALANQYCPYLDRECVKPRKSEPHVKVGICSIGYKGEFMDHHVPLVICPHRFGIESVFNWVEREYFPSTSGNDSIRWLSEVSLGTKGGLVDFVAILMKNLGGVYTMSDFLCVEIQTTGTTGSPWEAVVDLKTTGKFQKTNYKFGINWAMEYAKTMMQQAYKESRIVESWDEKIVFLLQDEGLIFLERNYDTSGLHPVTDSDSVHFCTFVMKWDEQQNKWDLEFKRKLGTNSEGIQRILGGVKREDISTLEDFKSILREKLLQ